LWLARSLALGGRWEEAHLIMEAAVDLAGPLHLLPTSVDPSSGEPLGNRPSAEAHVALISAALALSGGEQ
jgi:GH15 family glucan-1,4-alpha-glucosidase